MSDIVKYKHKCDNVNCSARKELDDDVIVRIWWDTKIVSCCPECGHFHIWINGTSMLIESTQDKGVLCKSV